MDGHVPAPYRSRPLAATQTVAGSPPTLVGWRAYGGNHHPKTENFPYWGSDRGALSTATESRSRPVNGEPREEGPPPASLKPCLRRRGRHTNRHARKDLP